MAHSFVALLLFIVMSLLAVDTATAVSSTKTVAGNTYVVQFFTTVTTVTTTSSLGASLALQTQTIVASTSILVQDYHSSSGLQSTTVPPLFTTPPATPTSSWSTVKPTTVAVPSTLTSSPSLKAEKGRSGIPYIVGGVLGAVALVALLSGLLLCLRRRIARGRAKSIGSSPLPLQVVSRPSNGVRTLQAPPRPQRPRSISPATLNSMQFFSPSAALHPSLRKSLPDKHSTTNYRNMPLGPRQSLPGSPNLNHAGPVELDNGPPPTIPARNPSRLPKVETEQQRRTRERAETLAQLEGGPTRATSPVSSQYSRDEDRERGFQPQYRNFI